MVKPLTVVDSFPEIVLSTQAKLVGVPHDPLKT